MEPPTMKQEKTRDGTLETGNYGSQDSLAPQPAAPSAPPPTTPLSRGQWLQILSTTIAFMNTWGFLLTSGAFEAYYELEGRELVGPGRRSSSDTAWISTTCAFAVLSLGVVAGPLFDRGHYRALLVGGSLLQVLGLMTLSLARRGGGYYQVFLAHGVAVGLGAGLLFTPSVTAAAACLPHAPTRARTMGLMASGSSVGGVVYPLMFRHLVPQIGFPWTVRAIAFVMLGLYLVSYLVFLDYRPTPRAVRQFLDSSAFADLPFMTISLASLLSAVAFYIPLLCVPLYAATKIPAIGAGLTLDLLPIMNGASFAGRILAGLAAAVFGPTETITVSLVFGSVMLFAWITVDTVAGIIAWSVWGMISGILVTLPGAFIPLFCPSLSVLGTRSGMYWIWVGLGMLIGNPIAGAIHDLTSLDDDWWRLQVFAAVFMLAAALVNIYPVIHIRRKASATA